MSTSPSPIQPLASLHEHDHGFIEELSERLLLPVKDCYEALTTPDDETGKRAMSVDASRIVSLDLAAVIAALDAEAWLERGADHYLEKLKRNPPPLSMLDAVQDLRLNGLELGALDLGGCGALRTLAAVGNDVEVLDVSANTALEALSCGDRDDTDRILRRIRLPRPCQLRTFECVSIATDPPLAIDLSACRDLTMVQVQLPPSATLDLSYNHRLRTLDLRESPQLEPRLPPGNRIQVLLTRSRPPRLDRILEHLPDLRELRIGSGTKVRALDLTWLPKLRTLICAGNQLGAIDLDPVPKLEWLDIANNDLTELDITPTPSLRRLRLERNTRLKNVTCTPAQQIRLPALRKFYALTAKEEALGKSFELHEIASEYDWNDGLAPLRRIIDHPNCDLATALLLYWRGAHAAENAENARGTNNAGNSAERAEFRQQILENVEAGTYTTQLIPFDPRDHYGEDLLAQANTGPDQEPAAGIPEVMTHALRGVTDDELVEMAADGNE